MKSLVCLTLGNGSDLRFANKVPTGVDLIELRLDLIKRIDLREIENKNNTIITYRKSSVSDKDRLRFYNTATGLGYGFIDVDYDFSHLDKIDRKKSRMILSYHDFKSTPCKEELEKIYETLSEKKPDYIKIVTYANGINDCFEVFAFLRGKKKVISHCMGKHGLISRILGPKYGSSIQYLCQEEEIAPGQMNLEDFATYNKVNAKTRIVGVIGEYAENSKSRFMHNANFKALGLNFVYVPFKVSKDNLGQFMKNFRDFAFSGAAVTVPHKQDIVKYLDGLDKTASKIGATNTLVVSKKIIGHNTDYLGCVMAIKEVSAIKNKKVLIYGAGGAARAILFGLSLEGADITITNRTMQKAFSLAREFKVRPISFKEIMLEKFDIIINATSVGMNPFPDMSIVGKFPSGKLVMDIVYNPMNTKFLRIAKRCGCRTVSGDKMLLHQAVGQFRLWTGLSPDIELMRKALSENIG